jgi:type IV pilus assembly protein PilM
VYTPETTTEESITGNVGPTYDEPTQTQASATGGDALNPFDATPDAPPIGGVPPTQNNTPAVVGDPEVLRLYNAIAPVVEEFVSEVRRSIDYFRSRGGQVDRVVLCGGGTKLKGLSEHLAKVLGIPCDAYDPLRRLNVNARKVAPQFIDDHRQEFAVAIGNGLHIFFD